MAHMTIERLPILLSRRRLSVAIGLALVCAGGCSRESKDVGRVALSPKGQRGATERAVDAPDLEAAGILLPGLIDSSSSGTFVDLVVAMSRVYEEGSIKISAYPRARAYTNVISGQADFAFPVMRLGAEAEAKLPYRFSTESVGRVSFVLYSHVRNRLSGNKVRTRAAEGRPYSIAAPDADWGFPTQSLFDFSSTFNMVDAGRLDGCLWAQEEADLVLRGLGLTSIHREHFQDFDDVFILPRSPRGDFVDKVLTRIVQSIRARGALATHYAKVHQPYRNWQPYRD